MRHALTSYVTQHRAQLLALLVMLADALLAWLAWFAEIVWIKGWASLAWLQGYTWSATPICICIAAVSSAVLGRKGSRWQRAKFIVATSFLMWLAFDIGRATLFQLGVRWLGPAPIDRWLLTLFVADIGVAFGVYFCAHRLLSPLRRWTWPVLALALLLTAPLSAATIALFPALRGQTDAIHAVKMGYPVFWTALLVPLCLWLGRKPLAAAQGNVPSVEPPSPPATA